MCYGARRDADCDAAPNMKELHDGFHALLHHGQQQSMTRELQVALVHPLPRTAPLTVHFQLTVSDYSAVHFNCAPRVRGACSPSVDVRTRRDTVTLLRAFPTSGP
jgi:hypothetical protein